MEPARRMFDIKLFRRAMGRETHPGRRRRDRPARLRAARSMVAADPLRGGFQALASAPHGFMRTVALALEDDPATIVERVRETLED